MTDIISCPKSCLYIRTVMRIHIDRIIQSFFFCSFGKSGCYVVVVRTAGIFAQIDTMRSVHPRSDPTQPMSTEIISVVSSATKLPPCPTSSYTVKRRETLRESAIDSSFTHFARPRRMAAESLSSKKRLLI